MGTAGTHELAALRACMDLALIGAGLPARTPPTGPPGPASAAAQSEQRWPAEHSGARLAPGVDPRDIRRAALAHGIVGEVWLGARRQGHGDIEAVTRSAAAHVRLTNAMRLAALNLLAGALRRESVPAAAVKGLATAAMSRPDPSFREGLDIDLLVSPGDVAAAHTILTDLGAHLEEGEPVPDDGPVFAWVLRHRKELPYRFRGIPVDLHWRLGTVHSPVPDTRTVLGRASTTVIHDITVDVMHPDDARAHSAAHWRHDRYRGLKYVLDTIGLRIRAGGTGPAETAGAGIIATAEAIAGTLAYGSWHVPGPRTTPDTVSARAWRGIVQRQSAADPSRTGRARGVMDTFAKNVTTATGLRDALETPVRISTGPVARILQRR